jgi:hypothetical protein
LPSSPHSPGVCAQYRNDGRGVLHLGGTPFIATTLFGMTGTQYGLCSPSSIAFFLGNFLTARLATASASAR